MTAGINTKAVIFVFLFLTLTAGLGWSAQSMDAWPAGWKQSYLRFQRFIETRNKHWPASQLTVDPKGKVTCKKPDFITTKQGNYVVYEHGCLLLQRGCNSSFSLPQLFTAGTYTMYFQSVTELGYQYFPPLLHIKITEDDYGVKTCQMLDPKEEENHWPNRRGLLFIDFNTLSARLAVYIYTHNYKTNPSILLQVDHQANLHRKKLDNPNAERLLRWRIYHNGKLKESGPATGITVKPSTYGPGSYLAFLAIEGPQGWMPVSNLADYYIHPEKTKSPDSLIRHKNAPVQEIYRCGCSHSHFRDKSWMYEPAPTDNVKPQ